MSAFNCKACNAPLQLRTSLCEYCGTLNVSSVKDTGSAALGVVGDYVASVIKPDTYQSSANSIKPQLNADGSGVIVPDRMQVGATDTHWTAIAGLLVGFLVFLCALGTEKGEWDILPGFFFLGILAFAFDYVGRKNYGQKSWISNVNPMILIVSLVVFLFNLF